MLAEPILAALGMRERFAAVVGTGFEDIAHERETLGRALRELRTAGAEHVVDTPDELLATIARLAPPPG